MAYYRIVTDDYLGYEVQFWRWWWPFWASTGGRTFSSVADAEHYALAHSKRDVVCYLGRIPGGTP